MSYANRQRIRANGDGRTIGYVYESKDRGGWVWEDGLGVVSPKAFPEDDAAAMDLSDRYWAALEEYGREAHASEAHI